MDNFDHFDFNSLKSEINLKDIDSICLPCQQTEHFSSSKCITIPDTFKVKSELISEQEETINSKLDDFSLHVPNENLPRWGALKSLISNSKLPIMQTGFLPFIRYPVTEHTTVYTAMKNFIKVLQQLDRKALPIFCGEGVYRIVVDIYLKCPNEFKMLVPCLRGFHMAKGVQHCIGKYIRGSGLDDALVETQVFRKKVIEQVLNGTHYIRSLRAILILMDSINRLKWDAFWENNKKEKFKETLPLLETFYYEVTKITPTSCFDTFTAYKVELIELENDFTSFSYDKLQMCKYLINILYIANLLQDLICADRTDDWGKRLRTIEKLLPIFQQCDSMNYLRYASFYLEKMRQHPDEFPEIYDHFKN